MIEIEYTNDPVENEPGPNVYWRGCCRDFLRFLVDAHELGMSNGGELKIEDLTYVSVSGITSYRLRSAAGGTALCKRSGQSIVMELDSRLWRDVLHRVLSISFGPGFVYQEFDGRAMVEDANVIMASRR